MALPIGHPDSPNKKPSFLNMVWAQLGAGEKLHEIEIDFKCEALKECVKALVDTNYIKCALEKIQCPFCPFHKIKNALSHCRKYHAELMLRIGCFCGFEWPSFDNLWWHLKNHRKLALNRCP